jgi:hypothetical protein
MTVTGAGNWLLGHGGSVPGARRLSPRAGQSSCRPGVLGLALLKPVAGPGAAGGVDASSDGDARAVVVVTDLDRLGDSWPSAHRSGRGNLAVGRPPTRLEPKRVVLVLVETANLESQRTWPARRRFEPWSARSAAAWAAPREMTMHAEPDSSGCRTMVFLASAANGLGHSAGAQHHLPPGARPSQQGQRTERDLLKTLTSSGNVPHRHALGLGPAWRHAPT